MSKLAFNSLINLKLTQESGQTSQPPWFSIEDGENINYFELIFLKELDNLPVLIKVSQNTNDLNNFEVDYKLSEDMELFLSKEVNSFTSFSDNKIKKAVNGEIVNIFNLDFNLDNFYKTLIDNNEELANSIDFCNGLRLFLAKNRFECIISSICSANNSIARWTKSIDKIKYNWGFKKNFIIDELNNSKDFYGFPQISEFKSFYNTPQDEFNGCNKYYGLDDCTRNLKSCGVGYRSDYMKKSSDLLLEEIDINEIANMNYDEAFETISKLPGVGLKVADCILLYGYGFMEAFPSDVWIKRIVSYLYFDGKEISAKKTRDFGMEHFGDNAGYAQLYLFHYARKSGLMGKIKK